MLDQQLRDRLFNLIASAASKIDRSHFAQEPNYTAAFFGKLHGEEVTNELGQYIKFEFSVSNDRGPNSAENKTGVDIGMVFEWNDGKSEVFTKAVLMQAKNKLTALNATEQNELRRQLTKMQSYTASCVVMDCPYDESVPNIYEKTSGIEIWNSTPISLSDYIADYVLECLSGDTKSKAIEVARRSDRALKVVTNMPKPELKPTSRSAPGGPHF